MTIHSMRCPRCRLTQAMANFCKSCGAAMTDAKLPRPEPRFVPAGKPSFPSAGSAALAAEWSPDAETGGTRRLFFRGSAGSLLGIQLVNILLILCTLGVYLFWGKVRTRKYLLSQTEFEGDRFAYHGTGMELLVGSLKAMLVFGLPVTLLSKLPALLGSSAWIRITSFFLVYVIILLFIPFAIVGTRRYRLSRSSWRGIRFSFRGRALEFFQVYLKGMLLRILSVGLYSPFFAVQQYAFFTSQTYFGNRKFHFEGHGRDLLGSFLLSLLLTLPTLGIYSFWYQAKKQRYLIERTSFADARFTCTATGGGLCRLSLVNLLAVIGTLGFALPWAVVRTLRYWYAHIALEGPLDLVSIEQDAQPATATAEGLAGFLDLDFNLGG